MHHGVTKERPPGQMAGGLPNDLTADRMTSSHMTSADEHPTEGAGDRGRYSIRPYIMPVLRNWYVIPLVVALALLVNGRKAGQMQPSYEVSMVLHPAAGISGSGGGGGVGGALAALNISGDTGSPLQSFIGMMTSLPVLDRAQKNHRILQMYYDGAWDEETQSWRQSRLPAPYSWFSDASSPAPDLPMLFESLSNGIKNKALGASDLVQLSIQTGRPELMREILLILYHETEAMMRSQKEVHLRENIEYLRQRMAETDTVAYRNTLASMMSQAEMKLMLMNSSAPYSAEMLSPPTSTLVPVAHEVQKLIDLTLAIAFAVGVALTFVVDGFRRGLFWDRS